MGSANYFTRVNQEDYRRDHRKNPPKNCLWFCVILTNPCYSKVDVFPQVINRLVLWSQLLNRNIVHFEFKNREKAYLEPCTKLHVFFALNFSWLNEFLIVTSLLKFSPFFLIRIPSSNMNIPTYLIINNNGLFWILNDVCVDKQVLVLGKKACHPSIPSVCCLISI